MIQNSPEWFEARKGKITASRFGDVLAKPTTKRYQQYQTDLVNELLGIPDFRDNDDKPWFRHGVELEPKARSWYEWEMFIAGNMDPVIEIGMITHSKYDFISCSPDGLYGSTRGLEIKSRISHAEHLKSVNGGLPSNYKPQVLGSLWVTGLEQWDFVSFFQDPDGLIKSDINITEVFPDPEYFQRLESECLIFWNEVQEKVKAYG